MTDVRERAPVYLDNAATTAVEMHYPIGWLDAVASEAPTR